MRLGARLPGAKIAFLSRLSATSRAPHFQCLFLRDPHTYIMHVYPPARMVNFDQSMEYQQTGAFSGT